MDLPTVLVFLSGVVSTSLVVASLAHNRWSSLRTDVLQQAARVASEQAALHVASIERIDQRLGLVERMMTEKTELTHAQIERLRTAALN